jgi:hypothetical protein
MEDTCYTGIYVIRGIDEQITDVQVTGPGGEIPLSKEQYIQRGILPLITTLPDKEKYYGDFSVSL